MRSMLVAGLAAGVLLGTLLGVRSNVSGQAMGPPPAAALTPPFDLKDPTAIEAGHRLFQQSCTGYCHGREGRVSRAPKLRGRQFDPNYLYSRISNGWPPMPAFRTIFPPENIWNLVAYIMSLTDAKDE